MPALRTPNPGNWLVWLCLVAILLAGGALRFHGLNWDDGQHLHPDERFLAIVGDKIRLPSGLLQYFDTRRSPLNPYNQGFDGFAYGMAPLFLTRALGELVGMASYDRINLLGRGLSAAVDLGTVLLVFLLGRLVYGTAVGLLGAALLSVTVLHVQLAHFFAVDTFLAFFTTLALYAAYRAWLLGRALDYALLGAAAGLAVAAKLSALLLVPIVGLVVLVRPPVSDRRPTPAQQLIGLAVCGLAALLAYRVGEPYSFTAGSFLGFLPNEQRFSDLDRWVKISSGEIEVPYMVQWAGTPTPWFALRGLIEWGFGPALGAAALASLAIMAVRLRHWPEQGRHLLLVAWAVINLGYFAFQFAKFLRYLLPVYPALAVLTAATLVWLWGPVSARARPWARWVCRLAAPGVLGATAIYAAMFSSIYSRPNARVEASEWIYANVAPGSALAVEHWDDALPLGLPGRERRFAEVSMELYADESHEKAQKLAQNLRRADYIILSSNRLVGSIPRLPRRYPIAIEYYRLLLSGELGFDPVARFDSRPQLFGYTIDDSSAQEDFTVYDHPTVLIFQKAARFSAQRVAEQLAAVPLDDLERTRPVEAGARSGLMLSADEWAHVQASGTWSDNFALDGLAANLALPFWLAAVEALALASLPICWWLFRGLPDRGFAVAKLLGLLIASYLAWLAASLGIAPFGRGLAVTCLLVLAGLSASVVRRHGAEMAGDLRRIRKLVLATEAVFVGAFALMLVVRMANPDLWHPTFGGEKPMDFAYLNAVIKTPSFPPYDPWFAGGYINYYYYGFVLVAFLTHLSAVPPAQAYNLAIATIFAFTAVAAFAFGYAVAGGRWADLQGRPRRWPIAAGLGSAVALCLLGNLDGAAQVRDALWKVGGEGVPSVLPLVTGLSRAAFGLVVLTRGSSAPSFDFWRSTRFIGPEDPGPIHEFPFFTFLYGDLHAHMVSFPMQVVAALIGLQLIRCRVTPSKGLLVSLSRHAHALPLLGLGALVVGSLRATNTWDFPTYLLILGAAAVLMLRPGRGIGWAGACLVGAAIVGGLYLVSSLLFLPYLARYELFYSGVVPVKAITDVSQFLAINGLLLFGLGSWLTVELVRSAPLAFGVNLDPRSALVQRGYYSLALPILGARSDVLSASAGGLVLVVVLLLFAAGRGVLGLGVAVGAAGLLLAVARRRSTETLFLLALGAAALAALVLPELVAVRGDVGRMNTVFKFYLQAWVLLALLAGPALAWAARRLGAPGTGRTVWPALWAACLTFLVLCAAVYPLRATPIKLGLRFAPLGPTLDGMAYMARARYADGGRDLELPADYRAIRWVLENVPDTPVFLEGQAPLYHWGSRFSIYTGLPAVLGWDWHQKQQRSGYQSRVDERQRDVKAAYETISPDVARALLHKYGVAYIVVGGLERAYYSAAGLEKFDSMVGDDLEIAYREGGVTIYHVLGSRL